MPTPYLLACRQNRNHRIQSTLVRVVMQQCERISITKTFEDLHGLLVKYRIDFKVATMRYKVLQSGQPSYLSIINIDAPRRQLRSSADTRTLPVLQSKTKIGSLAFRHSALSIWNSLPIDTCNFPSVKFFKNHLKRFYIKQAFK